MEEDQKKLSIGKALGQVVSGIGILTVRYGDQKGGVLSSWFQQVGFEPPMIAVALKKGRRIGDLIEKKGSFVLNILSSGQKKYLSHFGRGFKPDEDPFAKISVVEESTENPILEKSLSYLECRLNQVISLSDHNLWVGVVVNGDVHGHEDPMVHFRKTGLNY